MYKKIVALGLGGMLVIGSMVGCGDSQVESNQPVQQEQQDENLNNMYGNINNAYSELEPIIVNSYGNNGLTRGVDYDITIENNMIVLKQYINPNGVANDINSWNELMSLSCEASGKWHTQYNVDVNVMVVNSLSRDRILGSSLNGAVIYDFMN